MNLRRLMRSSLSPGIAPYHPAIGNAALCITANLAANVADGSKADLTALKCDFRFTPESRLKSDIAPCPKSANKRHSN
jgi:hypothetical protein